MLSVTVAPTAAVVSLPELKAHLRIDGDDENDLLEGLISAATAICQTKSGRQFVTATFVQREDFTGLRNAVFGYANSPSVPGARVVLTATPVVEVVSCVDGDGNAVTYTLDESGLQTVLVPTTCPDQLVITYKAGYGTEPDTVPSCARLAVRVAASYLWTNRESGDRLPMAIDALLDPIRLVPVR